MALVDEEIGVLVDDEIAVLVDSNMGTNIALSASPNTSIAVFKGEVEKAHLNCFPDKGEIMVCGLMVKRKSHFYHLPDSLQIKHLFQWPKPALFLHMEARPLNNNIAETSSQGLSVTGIIHRYFSSPSSSDVTSSRTIPKQSPIPATPPADQRHRITRDEFYARQVGKRLVTASQRIGMAATMQRPGLTTTGPNSSSLLKSLVFEMPDSLTHCS